MDITPFFADSVAQEYDTPRTGGPLKAPVLFLHGLLGNQANFRAFTAKHPSLVDRRVLCVDARNHGLSPRSDDLRYVSLARYDNMRIPANIMRLADTYAF